MSFPLGDWQFWSVTAAAVGSVWMLVRPFLQRDASPGAGACGQCAQSHGGRCGAASAAPAGKERLVVLGGDRR